MCRVLNPVTILEQAETILSRVKMKLDISPRIACLSCGILTILLLSCSGKGPDPDPKVQIRAAAEYFPTHEGDTWYYEDFNFVRKIEGDTVINGYTCRRVLLGRETDQAWSITAERFAQHLFEGFLWFEPPLQIPFDLVKDEPYRFSALGRVGEAYESDLDSVRTGGTLTFAGYVSRRVAGKTVDSCIRLDYAYSDTLYFKDGSSEINLVAYSELYARGIGMVYDGSWVLDRAVIDGVTKP